MRRSSATPRDFLRIVVLVAALGLVHGCQERDRLEKEAPALAHADFRVDRIAVAGVVSNVAALGDSAENRESWSSLIGSHLGRNRFGKLPIVSSGEVREILGREDYGALLDRYQVEGGCDGATLADLHAALEGKARFVVFGNIEELGDQARAPVSAEPAVGGHPRDGVRQRRGISQAQEEEIGPDSVIRRSSSELSTPRPPCAALPSRHSSFRPSPF